MRWMVVVFCLFISLATFPEEGGLVAYWSFDEGKGDTAFDYSGNGNDAQIKNGKWVEGIAGNGVYLDGKGFIECGGGLQLAFVFSGDYSIEAWVKHQSKNPQIYIAKWTGSGSQSGWWLGYYEGVVQFGDYYEGGHTRIKGPDIADGKWHYVVGVREGTKLVLCVDGNKVAEGKSSGKVAGDNPAPVLIGGFGNGRYAGWAFIGTIDEVRVYSRALSEEEIRQRYETIVSGNKTPTLKPISQGLPLDFYVEADLASLYWAKESISFTLLLVESKPVSQKVAFAIYVKDKNDETLASIEDTVDFNNGQKVKEMNLTLPGLDEGQYKFEVYIEGQKKLEKPLIVRDIQAIARDNIAMITQRAQTNPFYRGIVSAYAGMRYKKDGTPDIDATISLLKDLGVNCYTYLIAYRSDKELSALGEFCDRALKEGIEVWVYLVPPSEAPEDRDKPISERKYPPFDMDYLKWAEAIAQISLKHPNLTLWMIDDFDHNLSFFTLDYTRQIYQTSKRINPNLLFGVCVYHESLESFIKAGYLPYTDALLWGYQHNSSLYPDCGLYSNTLPLEINDYLKTGKIAIPCIYFTPHSSWPEGRPTKDYLEKAMLTAFQQAGIVWVYTTPNPGTFQYEVVKNFTNEHRLQPGKW